MAERLLDVCCCVSPFTWQNMRHSLDGGFPLRDFVAGGFVRLYTYYNSIVLFVCSYLGLLSERDVRTEVIVIFKYSLFLTPRK